MTTTTTTGSSKAVRVLGLLTIIFGIIFIIAGGVTWVFALVMTLFEILVEFLQAYVFTLLSALYIGGALADDH